jgi:hypothetical protein
MIQVVLIYTSGLQKQVEIDVQQLVIDGQRLSLGNDLPALRGDGNWELNGDTLAAIEIHSPVQLHFEAPDGERSDVVGPFAGLWLLAGAILTFEQTLLAEMNATSIHWERPGDDLSWSRVVFSTPGP